MQEFVHLRLFSSYSLLKGAIKFPLVANLCLKYNMPAVGISDYHNLFGALEFSLALSGKGVQPIIGTVVNCALDTNISGHSKIKTGEALLIAQNEIGYKNLLKIVSESYLTYEKNNIPEFPLSQLRKYSDGVILLTGGIKGILGEDLKKGMTDIARSNLQFLQKCFGDRLYIEIIRDDREKEIERQQLELAYELNIPIVATNHVHFESPDMAEAHDVLLCIKEGKFISDTDRETTSEDYYFKSQEEMKELFKDLPEAIENTINIAKRCAFMVREKKPMLPKVDLQEGMTPDDALRQKATEGLKERLKHVHDADHQQYFERLDYELGVIAKMGFSSYFLIVSDFVQWSVKHNIPVGPGRGSGAGSIVAWSLLITNLDPIKFRLIFERFLNPERVSMPDFDIDFCQEKREQTIEYVCKKYGKERVGHIITFGKLQARAVLRDVGRVLEMPYNQVNNICKMVPQNPTNPLTLQQAIDVEPALQDLIKGDEQIARLFDIALKLEGLSRHCSTHAAGIVIANQDLDELVPLYKDPKSDIPVTQFNMKYVEKAGLVKFDFLGLKTLTMIQQTINLLKNRGIELDINFIPMDDDKTFQMVNRIETVGVFQLESTGMRDVIRRLKPDRFEDFIALVALYRPGPMDDIPKYVARKHGEEPIVYAHPLVKDILEPTYGVMVYQEQVMQIAQVMAGYSLGQADLLRRAMGKKIKEEMAKQKERFIGGCVERNIDRDVADSLFEQINKFAGYGFNKSHATPYALISYQTAYLKAHYPVEFMIALMNLDKNNTDKLSYFKQELDRLHITLLPPDINKSESNFSVEIHNDELQIRYGLSAVKGVGEAAIEELINDRNKNGTFKNISNFLERASQKVANKKLLESLICSGAFDEVHPNRRELYMNVQTMINYHEISKNKMQFSLFGDTSDNKLELKKHTEWNEIEKLNYEFEAIGFYLSSHPMLGFESELQKIGVMHYADIVNIGDFEGNAILSGIIVKVVKKISKNGSRFAFIHISDSTGSFEVVAFSDVFSKAFDILEEGKMVIVNSSIKQEGEMMRITAFDIREFKPMNADFNLNLNSVKSIVIKIKNNQDLEKINQIIGTLPSGQTEVKLVAGGKKFTLARKYEISNELLQYGEIED